MTESPARSTPLAELSYESWIVRRTAGEALRVAHTAMARGPGDVLVPLPWAEVRILDEAVTRAIFWTLWDFVVPWWEPPRRDLPGGPAAPEGPREPASPEQAPRGEPVGCLFSRAELPPELASRVPESWSFAQSFLWWPALPPPRGLAALASHLLPRRARRLAPVVLAVAGAASPFRASSSRVDIAVASTGRFFDFYVIDQESLVTDPVSWAGPDGTGLSLPGWAEPEDHVHWLRWTAYRPYARLVRWQLRGDYPRDFGSEMRARASAEARARKP